MTVNQEAAADAAGWVWANVARPLKFAIMTVGFLGSIGHMGRALIEGLTWWVKLVDLYHWIMSPVAGALELLLKAPILWVASWFDIALDLPTFPLWGVDVIVLANIAAGFLVFKRYLKIPAQFFVAFTIVLALSLAIYGGTAYAGSDTHLSWNLMYLLVSLLGLFLLWHSAILQVRVMSWADSAPILSIGILFTNDKDAEIARLGLKDLYELLPARGEISGEDRDDILETTFAINRLKLIFT